MTSLKQANEVLRAAEKKRPRILLIAGPYAERGAVGTHTESIGRKRPPALPAHLALEDSNDAVSDRGSKKEAAEVDSHLRTMRGAG